MTRKISRKELLAELEENNGFFDMVVDMFPARVFVCNNEKATQHLEEEEEHVNSKYHKKAAEPVTHKLNKSGKRSKKNQQKQAEEKNKQAEKRKKDGSVEEEEPEEGSSGSKKRSLLPAVPETGGSQAATTKTSSNADNAPSNVSRIESLRAKLQAKIKEKQANRPNLQPDQISKRAARRAEKKRRREEAQKRSNKKAATATDRSGSVPRYEIASGANATPAQDLQRVDYGRLTGLNPQASDPTERTKQALQNLNKPKNLHKILANAEAKQQQLRQLKESGTEQDKEKLASLQWKDTFKEADGTRIKDDPAKLKKQLKRKAAKKAKSAKAWKSRTDQVAAASQERQAIRQHNLTARKQGGKVGANLSRKEIRETPDSSSGKTTSAGASPSTTDTGKKLLSRAGFEGRKREFLNKEKKTKAGGKKQQ